MNVFLDHNLSTNVKCYSHQFKSIINYILYKSCNFFINMVISPIITQKWYKFRLNITHVYIALRYGTYCAREMHWKRCVSMEVVCIILLMMSIYQLKTKTIVISPSLRYIR